MYKQFLRPFFFRYEAEQAHQLVFNLLKKSFRFPLIPTLFRLRYQYEHPNLEKELFGLKFKNPIGLAAGFDKNAELIDPLASLGFGFIEIGTLTPKAQAGNPKPRLFRLPQDQALINRMGFNNEGVEAAIQRLRKRRSKVIVGGNIGKNKVTPNEDAAQDYLICFEKLFDYVDYFVVNVSSPNTPNLRSLQEKAPLLDLLQQLQTANREKAKPKPILLKIAPDLNEAQLQDIVEVIKESRIAGLIATNTTISREGLHTDKARIDTIGAGGLSGQPLKAQANEVIKYLRKHLGKSFPIIGVGGIQSINDVHDKLAAGADLVQIYSGFVYEGPAMVKNLKKALVQEGRL